MNCKPIGMDYFAMLKDRVIDGTSCSFPVDFVRQNHSGRAMCVDGICKVRGMSLVKFYDATVFRFRLFTQKKKIEQTSCSQYFTAFMNELLHSSNQIIMNRNRERTRNIKQAIRIKKNNKQNKFRCFS